MTIARSVGYGLTSGMPQNIFPEFFFQISRNQIFGVAFPVYVMIAFVVGGTFLLKRVQLGRFIYAVGGNEIAAKASGINVAKVKTIIFALSAFCSSIAGCLQASRLNVANSDAGINTALYVLTAVLLGGTSFSGGEGSLPRTVVGLLIMSFLINGLNLLNISSYWQLIVMGSLLVLIVGIDTKRRQMRLKKRTSLPA